MSNKTSIDELAALMTKPFAHLELGQINDHAAYVSRIIGEFPLHRHTQDEMYLVLEGEMTIHFKGNPELVLSRGESTVVRAFTTHGLKSEEGALVLLIKPKEMFATQTEME